MPIPTPQLGFYEEQRFIMSVVAGDGGCPESELRST